MDQRKSLVRLFAKIKGIFTKKPAQTGFLSFNQALLRAIPFGLEIVDRTGTILYLNDVFKRIFGKDAVGKKCWDLYKDDKKQCPLCPLIKGIDIGKTERIEVNGVMGGKTFEIFHTGMSYNGADAVMEIFIDITERKNNEELIKTQTQAVEIVNKQLHHEVAHCKKLEEEMRLLSLTDSLTGLYNHRGVLTLGSQQLKSAKRDNQDMVLLFADLDNLKWINDNFGHTEGDAALIATAGIIKSVFRESDIAARTGGDEFVVMALDASKDSAKNLLEKLENKFQEFNAKSKLKYPLSLSVGMAYCSSAENCTIEHLLSKADTLMYEHKKSKKTS